MGYLFNIAEAISPYQKYCAGYGTPGASGGSYITGLTIATGKSKVIFRHDGITVLDDINAFDLAEIEETYLGQINMVTVSSFCGPMGAILGYDLLKDKNNFYSHEFLKDGYIVDSKKELFLYIQQSHYEMQL